MSGKYDGIIEGGVFYPFEIKEARRNPDLHWIWICSPGGLFATEPMCDGEGTLHELCRWVAVGVSE